MRTETPRACRGRGYRRLFSYAAPYKRDWAAIVAATLLSTALSLLQPWPLKVLVDHVLGDTPLRGTLAAVVERLPWAATPGGLLAWVVLAGILVFAVNSAVDVVLSLQWTRVGRRMVYQLARDLFARVQRRSLRAHASQSIGDAMGRVAVDAWCVHAVIDTMLFAPGHALFTTVVMVVVMFRLDAGLTLLALAVAPFMTAAAWLFGRPIREAARARREIESRIQAHVHQTLTGVSVVQAFAREEDEQRRFQDLASVAIQAHQRSTLVGSLYGLGSGLVTTMGTAAVMWAAAMRVLDGRLTVGTALVFLAYLASLQWQLSAFANMYTTLQSAGASIDRVMDVFTGDDAVPEQRGARALPPVRGDVSIEDVVFGYLPGRPVLRGVSIAAAAGETIAIVGSTGAGKTTLVGLIPRFFDPAAGRVLIDGHDVRQVQIKSLRDQVAIVLQEPFLFSMSVAENISLGRPDATRGEIEAAARAANAHDFIAALPHGYDTIIGERGTSLSGGERQRMAIARALLKNAPILVLDEPTSALDAQTEHAIVDGLQRLMRGRTTFIVAHRLSTIRNATRIVVLEDGQVVEQGSHRQLLTRGGRFSQLHHLQFAQPAGSAA
jgi:ATP-binding cassette subfamily B protein/subfamily B ATP-binding cassette protein MsbA